MKRTHQLMAVFLVGMMLFAIAGTKSASAFPEDEFYNASAFYHIENEHARVVNSLLISANDQIMANSDQIVKMAKEYSCRDCLLNIYGINKDFLNEDSISDAFLMGMKVNNLVYLIHVADCNPEAKKMAVCELRMLSKIFPIINGNGERDVLCFWADSLETGCRPSTQLSHMFVHRLVDMGEYYQTILGPNTRYYFWLGAIVDDYTLSRCAQNMEWMQQNQWQISNLYKMNGARKASTATNLCCIGKINLCDTNGPDMIQSYIDQIKARYMDRTWSKVSCKTPACEIPSDKCGKCSDCSGNCNKCTDCKCK